MNQSYFPNQINQPYLPNDGEDVMYGMLGAVIALGLIYLYGRFGPLPNVDYASVASNPNIVIGPDFFRIFGSASYGVLGPNMR